AALAPPPRRRSPSAEEIEVGRTEEVLDVDRTGARAARGSGAAALLPLPVRTNLLLVEAFAQRVLAEFIVELALLRVPERLVGAVHGLEARLGLLVSRVLVGVEVARELAVGLLDRRGVRVARDPQDR